jgi:hypothetical protein
MMQGPEWHPMILLSDELRQALLQPASVKLSKNLIKENLSGNLHLKVTVPSSEVGAVTH